MWRNIKSKAQESHSLCNVSINEIPLITHPKNIQKMVTGDLVKLDMGTNNDI